MFMNAAMLLMLWGQIGEEFYWADRLNIQATSFKPERLCARVWGLSENKYKIEYCQCGK